ncbi:uncharacterized protein METZ01_LOCUS339588, partial [marine metagenome]
AGDFLTSNATTQQVAYPRLVT